MNDIASALSSILSSPDGIEQIKSVASMLGVDPTDAVEGIKGFSTNEKESDDIDLENILKMKKILDAQKNVDNRDIQLLDALKPFLSENRVRKMEQAKKIMKLIDMLPLLSQLGLFKF